MQMRSVLVMGAILGLVACGDDATSPAARTPGGAMMALGVDPATGAQLETNKDDYSPGEVVHLRGSGWAPGESIQLHMTESPDTHGDVDRTVVADGTGTFSIHFYDVQVHDLGVTFTLTGTGATSGSSVTVTFTDGNIQLQPNPDPNPFSPNGDAVADALTITARHVGGGSDHSNVTISIRAGALIGGTLVRTFSIGAFPVGAPDEIRLWDGKNGGGVLQPDGVYTLRLFSDTDLEGTASGQRIHTVFLDNTGPAISGLAATPSSVQIGSATPVVISATATDVYSNIASARVTIDGGAPIAMAATNPPFLNSLSEGITYTIPGATVAALTAGAHTFCVTATDAINNTTAPAVCGTLTITPPANQSPTASAGGPYSGNEGASINISGSGADPDGGTVTYLWTSSYAGCTFGSATSATTTVTCNDNGAFTLTLTVTDDEAVSTPANAALNVANVAPTVVIAPSTQTINEGSSAAFTATVTDPGSADTHTFLWSTNVAACTLVAGSTLTTATFQCNDNGNGSVSLSVTDDDGANGGGTAALTVNNVAPTVVIAPSTQTINEGSNAAFTATVTDPGSADTHTFLWSTSVGACTLVAGSTLTSATFQCNDNGSGLVSLSVTDDDGANGGGQASLTVNNVAPTVVVSPSSATINEGGSQAFTANVTDPGSADTHTFLWSTNIGPCTLAASPVPTLTSATFTCVDNGSGNVTLTVTDDDGAPGSDFSPLTVNNVAPALTALTGTTAPAPVNTTVSVTPTFTDPAGTYDTYTAWVNWDDGNGFVNAGVTASGTPKTRTFSQPGVYTVCAYIKDEDGGTSATLCYEYIVVYDPSAGFATGGGWINSPAGAYAADAALTGKATFGFVSKYLKGATTPTGNTEFQFHAASFVFNSTSYNWLVVSGPQAQYKGTGTVNGVAGYGFLLTARDGQEPGGGGIDKFRIKVWRISDGVIVYDNQMGQLDDSSAASALGGGSIVIHSK